MVDKRLRVRELKAWVDQQLNLIREWAVQVMHNLFNPINMRCGGLENGLKELRKHIEEQNRRLDGYEADPGIARLATDAHKTAMWDSARMLKLEERMNEIDSKGYPIPVEVGNHVAELQSKLRQRQWTIDSLNERNAELDEELDKALKKAEDYHKMYACNRARIGTFEWAVVQMKAGRKLKRPSWVHGYNIAGLKGFPFSEYDYLATDWEVVK